MRLIALAQGSSPSGVAGVGPGRDPTSPSLSALKATRYAPIPPPRMGIVSPRSDVPTDISCATATGSVAPTMASASSPTLAPAAAVVEGGVTGGAGVASAIRDSAVWSGAGALGGVGGIPAMGLSTGPATSVDATQSPFAGVPPAAVNPSLGLAGGGFGGGDHKGEKKRDVKNGAGREEEEEEDFGDFASAEETPQLGQPAPQSPRTGEKDDDMFGDFSGAPDGAEALTTTSAVTSAEGTAAGAVGDGVGNHWDAADAWMRGNGEESSEGATGSGRNKAELDNLMKKNLQATTVGTVHLADLVSGMCCV